MEDDEDFEESRKETKLNLKDLQERYEKFKKDDENINNVVKPNVIRQRFADFRKITSVWTERVNFRKRMKRTFLRNKASLRQALTTAIKNFTIEKEIIVNTLESYTTFHEKFERKIKDEKILNNFLADLPSTGQIIEVSDLERHVQAKIRKFSEDSKVLTDFI